MPPRLMSAMNASSSVGSGRAAAAQRALSSSGVPSAIWRAAPDEPMRIAYAALHEVRVTTTATPLVVSALMWLPELASA